VSEKSSLEEITIRSLGVIDSATITLAQGLTVLTGETGAGKTMVLTALTQILGANSDSDLVRIGQERSVVSGTFSMNPRFESIINEDGFETENGSLIITRTVSSVGKSRITVGGIPSTTSKVAEIATGLIEIHAQSSSARLSKSHIQREILDQFAQISHDLAGYQEIYLKCNELRSRISDLRKRISQRDREIAGIKEFISEFQKINPVSGEIALVEAEIIKLGSVEVLHSEVSKSLALLEDEEQSVFNLMQEVRKSLESIRNKDSFLDEIIDRYLESLFLLQETSGDLASYLSNLEADPNRFDYLQLRRASINALVKKYGVGSDKQSAFENLLLEAELSKERLLDLTGGDQRLLLMQEQLETVFEEMQMQARRISELRSVAAVKLSRLVTSELSSLSMPHAHLEIELLSKEGNEYSDFAIQGVDEVRFLFSAHAGGVPMVLSKIASGGELSRVMLALEVVLAAHSPVGTYVFDEIDAGIGGKAAVEVGRRLAKLAKDAQVIVVTHLAQVAVWADHHLVVQKNETGLVTQSDVFEVFGSDRETEIARMLSGQEDSITAREHAAELLKIVRERMIS
jgi:DNA repair protein RecN (Recombination protein N)